MNRRGFFKSMGLIVGGIAVEQAIPLGRVWSFPTQIARPKGLSIKLVRAYDTKGNRFLTWEDLSSAALRIYQSKIELAARIEG